ncbi:hypothetical protein EYA84_02145 [Verrucosispora sp. SN26_14.1]|uniref:hypothetical protein n=1 Tax=Verrucosispora sp. SN26_14.1 TaxID=2527879 RepID=UPI0010342EB8|nr:hypothetical protein [Verrucosispora sp. SN26_14.1]TBL44265.1 hypothetical protein EYA84_02145 [Verrucosispora sp. SN26_14.1]
MSTCAIVTEFLGITLDPCGLDATHASVGRCERGHTRERLICSNHASAFAAVPTAVVCQQCDDEGHETQMVVTVSALDETQIRR